MCLGPYFPERSSMPLTMLGESTPLDEWEASRRDRSVESRREKFLLRQSKLTCQPTAVRRLMRALAGWGSR